eukprot:UN03066
MVTNKQNNNNNNNINNNNFNLGSPAPYNNGYANHGKSPSMMVNQMYMPPAPLYQEQTYIEDTSRGNKYSNGFDFGPPPRDLEIPDIPDIPSSNLIPDMASRDQYFNSGNQQYHDRNSTFVEQTNFW